MTGFTISHGAIQQAEGLTADEMQDLHTTIQVLREMDAEGESTDD